MNYTNEDVEMIARVCHAVNAAYCAGIGDHSQPTWDVLPENLKASTRVGVLNTLMNPNTTPEEAHNFWLQCKVNEGYVYGVQKDNAKKTHPCILPYSALPQSDRVKDYLFNAVVHTLAKEVSDGTTNNQTK